MEYVRRKDWGAIESGRKLSPFRVKPVGVVVHHTTGSATDPAERIKAHDKYHTHTLGWKSIGYNFLVGENGLVFEGRGWHQGAATKGWNWRTISVAYIGSGDEITEQGKEGFQKAVDLVTKRYGDVWVKCHRDFARTYCPAEKLSSWVKEGMPKPLDNPSSVNWVQIGNYIKDIGRQLAHKPLRKGSRGKYVVLLQQQLNARIATHLVCDGIFGRKTLKAVKKFQRNHPIMVDGIVGPITWRFLWTV
tara:strand:+ start:1055 stop:1795 length:741 start_codon:yes stop_codon:yes gene_type:complete